MESIVVALITGGMALAGSVISNLSVHSKTIYRIEQLERKQDLHNSVITRMYAAENAINLLNNRQNTADHRIDALERKVD